MEIKGVLRISVVLSPAPRECREVMLQLAVGSTVAHAIQGSGLLSGLSAADADALGVGVWGRKALLTQALRDYDRVELYRPLRVDPKVARRERFTRQGARSAGLFARRRDGAKAGY
jgi:putative ubiquitin-RnfH superfamily antitoxin RatB of RatAB toxin-antitoxin module